MGNPWLHLIFLSLFSVATIYSCLGAQNNNTTVACSEKEGQALLKFKHSVKDNSRMLSSWGVGTDCCHGWEGVLCDDATGSVVSLHLKGNAQRSFGCSTATYGWTLAEEYSDREDHRYLVGEEMNFSLTELRHLNYLDLSGNDFHGSRIPQFIGSFKQLRYLNLSNAGFAGKIPHQIGNLSNLKVLDLNSLSYSQELMMNGDISWISSLSSLQHLDLNGVDLSGAPNHDVVFYTIPLLIELSLSCCGFSNAGPLNLSRPLPNIKHLDLSWNSIEGRLPPVLTNMSSLLTLDLSGNILNSSIPVMPSLLKLDLSYNNFRQIEHIGIWRRCHLKELFVSSNQLGEEMVGPSTNKSECSDYAMEVLDLSANGLNGLIPESLGKLTRLRVLHLELNDLKGPIPETLWTLRLLKVLHLYYNQLNGSIPESIGSLTALTDLKLGFNQLTGPIPSALGRLSSLQTFTVNSNSLNGKIPVSFGLLTRLQYLDISNNSLEGVVSEAHFANLSMLKYMDANSNYKLTFNFSREWVPPFQLDTIRLSSCKIVDEYPQWLCTQRKLRVLEFSNTSISGPLPMWLRRMSYIQDFDVSHNKLFGPLTNLFLGGRNLQFVLLQNNFFNESIPRSLCRKTTLVHLDLSRNRLTGKIPICLENLQSLDTIMLSSNELSGVIPNISPSLSWLTLNENYLMGELPENLANLTSLSVLDLGENELSGNIPEWIGEKLKGLVVLRLHKNNFTGIIPQSLCNNSGLQILDVANNNLHGPIPHCFGELYGMIGDGNGKYIGNLSQVINGELYVMQVIKGLELTYTKTLALVISMDLSDNNLVGEIPQELTRLSSLMFLNLSRNYLNGSIPDNIGKMKALDSLDLSVNELTGIIPPSMSALNFLSRLNLSQNNLSGRIPTGNQLQTLIDPSIYDGNKDLCGAPLTKNCSHQEGPTTTITSKHKYNTADEPKKEWFYLDVMCGFATGFWGVIGVLIFKKQWRHKLFRFAEATMDKIHIAVAMIVTKMKRLKRVWEAA